jgi:hypothetical protein
MGKGVGQLLELCGGLGRPVVIFGGRVELGRNRPRALLAAKGLVDIADTETALRQPARLLACLAGGVAAELP